MSNLWFISDTHFSHENMLRFTNHDGERTRPEFASVQEMDQAMIDRWNSVVQPGDKIYHLGDVGFDKNALDRILPKLHGHKRLILGNHDTFDMHFYRRHFDKILVSWRGLGRGLIFSHYPLLIDDQDRRMIANVHGHIHRSHINNPRYINISVEVIDYTPVHADTLLAQARALAEEMQVDTSTFSSTTDL